MIPCLPLYISLSRNVYCHLGRSHCFGTRDNPHWADAQKGVISPMCTSWWKVQISFLWWWEEQHSGTVEKHLRVAKMVILCLEQYWVCFQASVQLRTAVYLKFEMKQPQVIGRLGGGCRKEVSFLWAFKLHWNTVHALHTFCSSDEQNQGANLGRKDFWRKMFKSQSAASDTSSQSEQDTSECTTAHSGTTTDRRSRSRSRRISLRKKLKLPIGKCMSLSILYTYCMCREIQLDRAVLRNTAKQFLIVCIFSQRKLWFAALSILQMGNWGQGKCKQFAKDTRDIFVKKYYWNFPPK